MSRVAGMVRVVDNLGRIVIPKETRDILGIKEGDPIEIFHDQQGSIMLRKYNSFSCVLCGNTNEIAMFKNKFICRDCFDVI